MGDVRTKEDWYDEIKKDKIVALFTAGWCPDCRFIEPDLPEIEAKFPSYTFLTVDRDERLDIAQEYGVMGIPSFLVFHKGKEVARFVSKDRKTKQEIITFLNEV